METDNDAEKEGVHVAEAARDLSATGRTGRRCLRCGGELAIEVRGTSYRVWCRGEGIVLMTSRGI